MTLGLGRVVMLHLSWPVEVTSTEVTVAPALISPASDSRIDIALASGHRLTLSGAFDPDMVVRLARGLSA